MYDHGYSMLAAAIVEQAVADWRYLYGSGGNLLDDDRLRPLYAREKCSFRELSEFFRSEWCGMLCSDEMQEQAIIRLDAERMKAALKQPSGRNSIPYEHNGEWHTVKEWAQISGINRRTLYTRIARGMTMTEAITKEYTAYKPRTRTTHNERKDK